MSDAELHDISELERHLGLLARSITEDDRRLSTPPADLFTAITDEVAADKPGAEAPMQVARFRPLPRPAQRTTDLDLEAAVGSEPDTRSPSRAPSTMSDLSAERRRRRGLTLWSGLSAAAALAVLAVSALYLAGLADDDPGAGTTLASATIANDGLPVAFDRTAEANLVDVDGDLQLDVRFSDDRALPTDVDGFYEVWLIDENVEGMISLGVLTADGRVDVPDTMDPAAYPVVDISVEPLDGDPTHSGQSVLRGVLDF